MVPAAIFPSVGVQLPKDRLLRLGGLWWKMLGERCDLGLLAVSVGEATWASNVETSHDKWFPKQGR